VPSLKYSYKIRVLIVYSACRLGGLVMARQRIELAAEEADELSRRARATTVSVRDRRRAEIILLSAQGLTQLRIAEQIGISRLSVNRWVGRFALHRLDGLTDRAGRGRKPWLPRGAVQQVVEQAVTPPAHLGRWSCRTMARAAGISPASVQRLWAASDIKPHLSRTFKLSNDKRFEEKFWDVIGLYLNPPDKALVLCCDEKSQCQALERTQPGLPLGIGHIRTKTHDYVRHGTLTLFAALNYLEGKLITRLAPRHRHQEWLAFLKTIDEETPGDLDIHIIADNYATHKHPAVTRWLDRHIRFHMHYTPTSSSWMNLVERFFRDLTEFITEKSFASTRELADAIIAFLAARNENPQRYVWKAKGEDILRKINTARQALAESNPISVRHTREPGREYARDPDLYRHCLHPFLSRSGALSRAAGRCRYRAGARGSALDRGGSRRLRGQFVPPDVAMADHLAPCCGNSVPGRGEGSSRRLWIEFHYAGAAW
jgi:transposase